MHPQTYGLPVMSEWTVLALSPLSSFTVNLQVLQTVHCHTHTSISWHSQRTSQGDHISLFYGILHSQQFAVPKYGELKTETKNLLSSPSTQHYPAQRYH
jgi:hypothetical protein